MQLRKTFKQMKQMHLTENGIKVTDNCYNFSKEFTLFVTIKDLTEKNLKVTKINKSILRGN